MTDFDPPLTEAELDLRDLLRNPRRKRERERWARECVARYRKEHPPKPKPEPKARRHGRPKPKPMGRWGGVVDEPK